MPRKPASIEEVNLRLDADLLPLDFSPQPTQVRRWFTRNVLQGVWGILFGWTGARPKPLAVTDAGWLKVAASSVPFEHNSVFAGTAGDVWSADLVFPQNVSRIDVFVWDNPLLLQRATQAGVYEGEIEIPTNSMYSFDVVTSKVRVKNKTAGLAARYQIVGWY